MHPDFPDMPPAQQEMVSCAIAGALAYEVPANVVLAVAEKEGGKPGQWVRNSNGTYDVGSLQLNTAWLRELRSFGIEPRHAAASGCFPYELAAWRLRKHIRDDSGEFWSRVANYHSRTPGYNARYRQDLRRKAAVWARWLDRNFATHTVNISFQAGAPSMSAARASQVPAHD